MKNENLAIEPKLVPEETVEQKAQPDIWVQEEEKLRNEVNRWEKERAEQRLAELLAGMEFRKLVL